MVPLSQVRDGACTNHDASSSRSQGRFVFADDRTAAAAFWQPRRESLGLAMLNDTHFPFYYSFREGNLYVLVWDASSAVLPEAQLAWAERMLTSPEAKQAGHRLVIGHLPLRSVGEGKDRVGETLAHADAIQALLERHRVTAYVSGHHHAWFPGRIGELDLIQLGALGSGPRRLLGQQQSSFQTITQLDFNCSTGERKEFTLDLSTEKPVQTLQLPVQIVDRQGRRVMRRQTWNYD